MTATKSERLLNLLITLLVARTYVPKERIRQVIEEYRTASDEAFDRKFDRDKEDLRALGVPIEVGTIDPLFDDEPGYRILRSAFELPDIELSPEEAAVVGLAARVWQHAGLASATSDALVKLKAAGVEVDRAALNMVQPQLAVQEPTFDAFWAALSTRTQVSFDYRTSKSAQAARRRLQPWGVATFRGRWYVAGHDVDRDAARVFRLSRVQGEVSTEGSPGAYEVPPGTDLRKLTTMLVPADSQQSATLLVREGAALGLRRRARMLVEGSEPGWDLVKVDYGNPDSLLDEVLGFAEDALVVEPAEVRDLVVRRLRESA